VGIICPNLLLSARVNIEKNRMRETSSIIRLNPTKKTEKSEKNRKNENKQGILEILQFP